MQHVTSFPFKTPYQLIFALMLLVLSIIARPVSAYADSPEHYDWSGDAVTATDYDWSDD